MWEREREKKVEPMNEWHENLESGLESTLRKIKYKL